MKIPLSYIAKGVGILQVISVSSSCSSEKRHVPDKPNIIFIFADDLGYGDLGCYGQKIIETPNIDLLAKQGRLYTQYYSGSPVCAPSRCVLMTGKHSGHAYIRSNGEMPERGPVWDYLEMFKNPYLEGQHPIPSTTTTVARLLQKRGYKTGIVGKWGLGYPGSEGVPNAQGFDFFYGYNCQRQAHTYYPLHLYRNDKRVYLNNDTIAPHTKLKKGADPYDLGSYSDFTLNQYAPDLMFEEITGFVKENRSNPFFLYWATIIPHVPLQAPKKWVDYYVRKIGDEEPYLADDSDRAYFPTRYPHSTYAAMISYLDEQVGKLIELLKEEGIYNNTIVMFSSDNGPANGGGSDSPWFKSGGPFKCEPGFAKGNVNEGGIRVPLIVSWHGKISPGKQSDLVCAAWDILPTFCEIAGIRPPEDIDGISIFPDMLGKRKQQKHEFLYWEFPSYGGQQALRMGKWKGMRKNIFKGNMEIELYDLEMDPQELNNISAQHPEIIKKMEEIMKNEHTQPEVKSFNIKQLGDI